MLIIGGMIAVSFPHAAGLTYALANGLIYGVELRYEEEEVASFASLLDIAFKPQSRKIK